MLRMNPISFKIIQRFEMGDQGNIIRRWHQLTIMTYLDEPEYPNFILQCKQRLFYFIPYHRFLIFILKFIEFEQNDMLYH